MKKINYHVPELLAAETERLPSGLRILDAGCGTGLNASVLKRHASVLTGVDLSPKMIGKAGEKQLYDHLETDDILAFCANNPSGFDFVVMADVACYFGKLESLARAALTALGDGGRLFMTLEKAESDFGYILRPSGRFAHTRTYSETVLQQTGFEKIDLRETCLREENGVPVVGFVVTAEKSLEKSN